MRLFLTSYRFGNYAGVLQSMLDEDAQVGIITNAKDYKTQAERLESVKNLFASFKEIDITPHEIDLRKYFAGGDLVAELGKYDFIWLAGGNTFVLRRALKQSGADKIIIERAKNGSLLLGGESAGAILVTPTFTGVEFGDDPYVVPDGYNDEEIWDGLGLLDFSIVPHYESGWDGDEKMIDALIDTGVRYITLNDQQVLVVNGDYQERLG